MNEDSQARKCIIQLESQNAKFKALLTSTIEMIEQDKQSPTLKSTDMHDTLQVLHQEKAHIENELHTIYQTDGQSPDLDETIINLEKENLSLRSKLSEIMLQTKHEAEEISRKESNIDDNLSKLQAEKEKLFKELDQIKIEKESNPQQRMSHESMQLHKKLLELEAQHAQFSKNVKLSPSSADTSNPVVLKQKIEELDELRRDLEESKTKTDLTQIPYIDIKIRVLENQREELLNELRSLANASQEEKIKFNVEPTTSPASSVEDEAEAEMPQINVLTTETYVLENDGNVYNEMGMGLLPANIQENLLINATFTTHPETADTLDSMFNQPNFNDISESERHLPHRTDGFILDINVTNRYDLPVLRDAEEAAGNVENDENKENNKENEPPRENTDSSN